ncbi:MAG: ArnT family glycosyltransferase [Candidatus Binataceae bacterium]
MVLIILGLAALATSINEGPLVDWDEATYAQVAHEATANGSYLHFTWNGDPYVKKPPLLLWMVTASFKAFGETEWAARLPSVLMGMGTLLLVYFSAAAVAGRLGGFFAGLIPLGFYFFIARGGRECATDAPLVFFSMLAVYALIRARNDRRWAPIIGVACGLAILSKGLAGLIPIAVVAISVLALPGFSVIGIGGLLIQFAIAVAVAAPWFIIEAISRGDLFWSTFVKQETLARLTSHLEDQPNAQAYSLITFAAEIRYLWPILLPLAGLSIAALRRGALTTMRRLPPELAVWFLWLGLALGAACAVQTKLGWYILPALIPVALVSGVILAGAFRQDGAARRYCMPLGVLALAIIMAGAPALWQRNQQTFQTQRDRSRPSYIMGVAAREAGALKGGGELYFAGVPLPTLVYYSGMRCNFIAPANTGFELIDRGGNPVTIGYHELVLRDAGGDVSTVANFDDEWDRSGPYRERKKEPELDTALAAPDLRPPPTGTGTDP